MKKGFENGGTVPGLHPPITPGLLTGLCIVQTFKARAHGTGPGIGRSINNAGKPGLPDRSRTHQAGFQGDNQNTPSQPVVAYTMTGSPQSQNFCMGRRIMKALGLIMS